MIAAVGGSAQVQHSQPVSHAAKPAASVFSSVLDQVSFSDDVHEEESQPAPAAAPPPEHHSSGGGGILGSVVGFFSGAAHFVTHTAPDAVGHFVTHTVPDTAKTVATLPLALAKGHYNLPAPVLPEYPKLSHKPAVQKGASVNQPSIKDSSGHSHEPVTLIYHGSLDKLQNALQSQGWSKPSLIPMSPEKLNGQLPVLSLQKNAQLGGVSRDHMRIYKMGNNVYGIAATRDLHPTVNISPQGINFGHVTDNNLNGERDLIMNDVLHADPAASSTWQVVQGKPQASLSRYVYDGQVYEFSLP